MILSAISSAQPSTWWSVRKPLAFVPLVLLALSGISTTRAQVQVTSTWIGNLTLAASGNWSNSLFWLPPPQPGYNVVINDLLFLPTNVTLDVDATINQLSLGSGATLTIADGKRLELNASSTINGTLFMSATGGSAELRLNAPALTVSGTGTIVMSANANNLIRGGSSSDGLVNQLTIRGSGKIGDNQMGLVNQGTIVADNASVPLVIDPSAAGVTNTGTIRATAGASLVLEDGIFANTGGSIVADANSHVDVSNSTITGGNLTSTGTGHFHAINSFLSGLTIVAGSTVELSNGVSTTLLGNMVNDGIISLVATSGNNELKIDGAATVSGIGNITLSDATSNRILAASAGSTLTVAPSQSIIGAGSLGLNTLGLVNQGTIIAVGTNPLVLDVVGASFTNSGVLKASGTGGISLSDTSVTNLGTLEIGPGSQVNAAGAFTQSGVNSAIKLTGGAFSSTGLALQDGSLAGTGVISGSVTATGNATISPGGPGSIGSLLFTSNVSLSPSTSVFFDLGGTVPGTGHDRILAPAVALDGSLFLSFTNGFQSTVAPTDTLTLINTTTGSTLTGTFASLPDGSRLATLDGFGSFQVNYLPNTLTLSNFQPIPEPSTYVLLTVGAMGVLLAERRRRRRRGKSGH
ncbi:MAG: beta strand repeat-containing protein [Opitutaceae bacterium]